MDLDFSNENWVDSDMFDDLRKFAEEHAELELDLGTSYDAEQSTSTASTAVKFAVSSDDLLSFLEIEQPVQEIERTPPNQPISAFSPKLSSRRNGEIVFFNRAGELTQEELQDLLYYSGDPHHQNSETSIVNQNDMECDDKDGIVIIENTIAEYYKGALSTKGKLWLIRYSLLE